MQANKLFILNNNSFEIAKKDLVKESKLVLSNNRLKSKRKSSVNINLNRKIEVDNLLDEIDEALVNEYEPSNKQSFDETRNKKKFKFNEKSILNLSIHDDDDEKSNKIDGFDDNFEIECTKLTQEDDENKKEKPIVLKKVIENSDHINIQPTDLANDVKTNKTCNNLTRQSRVDTEIQISESDIESNELVVRNASKCTQYINNVEIHAIDLNPIIKQGKKRGFPLVPDIRKPKGVDSGPIMIQFDESQSESNSDFNIINVDIPSALPQDSFVNCQIKKTPKLCRANTDCSITSDFDTRTQLNEPCFELIDFNMTDNPYLEVDLNADLQSKSIRQNSTDLLLLKRLESPNSTTKIIHVEDTTILSSQKNQKFLKNGFANQLKRLLDREKSSVNFNKHFLNKNKTNQQQKVNNINLVPIKIECLSNYLYVIHGLNKDNNERIVALIATNLIDESKKLQELNSNYLIQIYPPWRRIYLKVSECNVYFCVNLFDIINNETNEILMSVDSSSQDSVNLLELDFDVFKCLNCETNKVKQNQNLDFENNNFVENPKCGNHFDYRKFNNLILNSCNSKSVDTSDNNELYCETQSQSFNKFDSSILDSLEQVGYFGHISFEAVVQRIYKIRVQIVSTISIKKCVLVSDRYNMFAQIQLPINFEINESFKYDFKGLKLNEKHILNGTSALDSEISYLWKHLTKSTSSSNSEITRFNYPKIVYLFDYVTNTSKITEIKASKVYIPVNSINRLNEIYEIEDIKNTRFTVNNIILLGLYQLKTNDKTREFYLYYVEDGVHRVNTFIVDDLINFDQNVLKLLRDNNILNTKITNLSSVNNVLRIDVFSTVHLSSDTIDIVCLNNVFKRLENCCKAFEFAFIDGKIMNVCTNESYFKLFCTNCDTQINRETEFFCKNCNKKIQTPVFKANIQVRLNCTNIVKMVKLNLHQETIKKILNINQLQTDDKSLNLSVILNKQIGPLYAFIYKMNEDEIHAKELRLI